MVKYRLKIQILNEFRLDEAVSDINHRYWRISKRPETFVPPEWADLPIPVIKAWKQMIPTDDEIIEIGGINYQRRWHIFAPVGQEPEYVVLV